MRPQHDHEVRAEFVTHGAEPFQPRRIPAPKRRSHVIEQVDVGVVVAVIEEFQTHQPEAQVDARVAHGLVGDVHQVIDPRGEQRARVTIAEGPVVDDQQVDHRAGAVFGPGSGHAVGALFPMCPGGRRRAQVCVVGAAAVVAEPGRGQFHQPGAGTVGRDLPVPAVLPQLAEYPRRTLRDPGRALAGHGPARVAAVAVGVGANRRDAELQ